MEFSNQSIAGGPTLPKIVKHGSLYFLINAATSALAILLLPFYTRHLSPEEYGIIATINATGQIIGVLMSLRLDSTFSRYFFDYNKDKKQLQTLFSTCFWGIIGLGIIVYLLSLVVGYKYYHQVLGIEFIPAIMIGFLTPLFSYLTLFNVVYFTQTHQSKLMFNVQMPVLIATHALSVCLLLFTGLKVNARIIPLFLGAFLSCLIFTFILIQNGMLRFKFDFSIFKKILPYSLGLMPSVSYVWINTLSDKLLLSIFGKMEETGIYSVGFQIGQGMMLLTLTLTTVYTPILLARLSDNFEEAIKSLKKSTLAVFWFMALMASYFIMFAPEIIHIFVGKEFQSSLSILGLIIAAYFVGSQHVIFVKILMFQKKALLISMLGLFAAVPKLIFNILLIPSFGKFAAAWSTLGASLIYATLAIYFVRRTTKLYIDWPGIFKTIAVVLILIGAFYLTSPYMTSLTSSISIKFCLVGLTLILSKTFNIFDKKTTEDVLGLIKSYRKKLTS